MTDRPYRFAPVQQCKVGDLLRVTVKPNRTDWAIVAENKRLVLLTADRGRGRSAWFGRAAKSLKG
jgi:tRNA(Met) C34 N-acetyltransferase TmcA